MATKTAMRAHPCTSQRVLTAQSPALGRSLVAFAVAAAMIVAVLASDSRYAPEVVLDREGDKAALIEAGGSARKVTYTVSHIGESYKKSTDYALLGRHLDPGLSAWWSERDQVHNETIVHNSYPYVVAYDPHSLISGSPFPPRTNWVTQSFYRLTVDAENISGLATGPDKDPWMVPIMGDKALDGGIVRMSLYFTHLSAQEVADIKAGVHYANSFYGVTGATLTNWTSMFNPYIPQSDGWFSELQGHWEFDRSATAKFLDLAGAGPLADQFNATGAANLAAKWRQEWINDGDMDMPLDIRAAYDYSLLLGNGPVFIALKLDIANCTDDKLAFWFWSHTWGVETLLVRYLEKAGVYKHWEPRMEDWYLNGTLVSTNGDMESRQTSLHHLTAWRDTDPGSYLSPAWLLEPQHIDHNPGGGPFLPGWESQFNNYSWGMYGSGYKPTRMCWIPGQYGYGKEVAYWQTPRNWNLTADETLIIKLPITDQGWGIAPYYSVNHTLPATAVGEMNAHAVTGEWVLGHGWPSNLYSDTYYDAATKTIRIPGGSSWEYKGNHNPAYPGAMEQGSPMFMLDISRVSHYDMKIVEPPPFSPQKTYTLQITPRDMNMAHVYCNQTVVLPAVAGVAYGESVHTFQWNESSWNTTVVFASVGPFALVSQDQYFYLDITDTYPVVGPLLVDLPLVDGWNLVSVPYVDNDYKASTLGLLTGDIVAGWDPTTQKYDEVYVVGVSPPFRDFYIEPNTGYWIMAAQPEVLELHGGIPLGTQSRSITVPGPGSWAIVGFNSLRTDMSAQDVVANYTGGSVTQVVAYNATSMTYVTYNPLLPFTDFLLIPGQGYWILVTASGVLTYLP